MIMQMSSDYDTDMWSVARADVWVTMARNRE